MTNILLYHWTTVPQATALRKRGHFENQEMELGEPDSSSEKARHYVGVFVSGEPLGTARSSMPGLDAELVLEVSLTSHDLRHYEVKEPVLLDIRFWVVPAGVLNAHMVSWKIRKLGD